MDSEDDKAGDNKTSSTPDNEVSESFLSKMGLCCFKFKEQSMISGLEFRVKNRQKKFGVDYLTLVEEKASQDDLKECLKEALADIAKIQEKINEHYDAIDNKIAENGGQVQETPQPAQEEEAPKAAPKKKKSKKKEARANPFTIDDE